MLVSTHLPRQEIKVEDAVRVLVTQLIEDDDAYNTLASKYLVDGKPSGVLSMNEMDESQIIEINAFAVAYAQRDFEGKDLLGILVVEDDKEELRSLED